VQNALWRYDVRNNSWSWISGFSVYGQDVTSDFPDFRYGCGSAGDTSRYGYVFGGKIRNFVSGNDLWTYDSLFNNWICIFGVCNSQSDVANSSYTDPVYPPGMFFARMSYSDATKSLIIGHAYRYNNTHSNAVWMYDLISSKWYYVMSDGEANYSAMGVLSSSNRPQAGSGTGTQFGVFLETSNQFLLFQLGTTETWALIYCQEAQFLSSINYTCISCTVGKVSASASGSCSSCPVKEQCTECPNGNFLNQSSFASCYDCAGGYSSLAGSANCVCGYGKYNSTQTLCTSCPTGKFGNDTSLSSCLYCSVGKFTNATSLSSCYDCPVGQFANGESASICLDCPKGSSSLGGSSSCISCPVGRTLSLNDGVCYRDFVPTMVWSWISGSSTGNTFGFTSTSFGASYYGKMVGSQTRSIGYVMGGLFNSSHSRRLYSFSNDFYSAMSLSECSSTSYTTATVESSTSCPTPRVANAVWLISDQCIYVFGGYMITCSQSSCYL
jgi:hypothetical protein